MSKLDKIKKFDPNNLGDSSSNIFGLPFTCEEADIVIVPVPWDVTVSYSDGTINGPSAVFNASFQVDLYDPSITDAWKLGIAMEEISNDVKSRAELLRTKAKVYIAAITNGIDTTQDADLECLGKTALP
jgi:agmatinase